MSRLKFTIRLPSYFYSFLMVRMMQEHHEMYLKLIDFMNYHHNGLIMSSYHPSLYKEIIYERLSQSFIGRGYIKYIKEYFRKLNMYYPEIEEQMPFYEKYWTLDFIDRLFISCTSGMPYKINLPITVHKGTKGGYFLASEDNVLCFIGEYSHLENVRETDKTLLRAHFIKKAIEEKIKSFNF